MERLCLQKTFCFLTTCFQAWDNMASLKIGIFSGISEYITTQLKKIKIVKNGGQKVWKV